MTRALGNRGGLGNRWGVAALAVLLAVSAAQHWRNPRFYYPVIPVVLTPDRSVRGFWAWALPNRREWVELSGAAELVLAVGLVIPGVRSWAARATAAMFAAFTVGHIVHLRRVLVAGSSRGVPAAPEEWPRQGERAFALVRLPLQIPLVLWAWRISRH